jgi:hypothetical protein
MIALTPKSKLYSAIVAVLARFMETRSCYVLRYRVFGSNSCSGPEVPRFQPFRDWGISVWHECKDVDLAVWLDRLDRLQTLNRARSLALHQLFQEKQIGVAHHQVEIFILQGEVNAYRGRLCSFSQCPKGKRECLVPGCGRDPFLQQHAGFTFWPDALALGKIMLLFDRRRGILRRASEAPVEGWEDHVATA